MREPTLFAMPEPEPEPVPAPTRREEARLVRPVRDQVEFVPRTLEELVAPGHPARACAIASPASDLVASGHSPGYRASMAHSVNLGRSASTLLTPQASGTRFRNASRS